jgi:hypothetical protein
VPSRPYSATGGFESGMPAGVAYVRKAGIATALGVMAARDAEARVARRNALLGSMFAFLN